jgi:hypothetical protein
MREKKIDSVSKCVNNCGMSDTTNESYYERNKEARREYQRQYYRRNSERIKRKRELDEVLEPEKIASRKDYNRRYYVKNLAAIKEKRKQVALAKKDKRN